jgi:hypothetical protein
VPEDECTVQLSLFRSFRLPGVSLLGEVVEAEREELTGEDALKACRRRQNYANAWVVVGEDLTVTPTRALDSAPVVADGDNMGQLSGSCRTRSTQRNKLSTRPTGEVVQVHSDDGSPVSGTHRSAHRVDIIFIWACVRRCIDCCPRKIDQ